MRQAVEELTEKDATTKSKEFFMTFSNPLKPNDHVGFGFGAWFNDYGGCCVFTLAIGPFSFHWVTVDENSIDYV